MRNRGPVPEAGGIGRPTNNCFSGTARQDGNAERRRFPKGYARGIAFGTIGTLRGKMTRRRTQQRASTGPAGGGNFRGRLQGARALFASPEQPSPSKAVSSEGLVNSIRRPANSRQSRRGGEPAQPHGLVRPPDGFHSPHHPPIRQDAVKHTVHLFLGRAVLGRIELRFGNILEPKQHAMVAPPEEVDLTTAKRTRAVVQQFQIPSGHDAPVLPARKPRRSSKSGELYARVERKATLEARTTRPLRASEARMRRIADHAAGFCAAL